MSSFFCDSGWLPILESKKKLMQPSVKSFFIAFDDPYRYVLRMFGSLVITIHPAA